MDLLVALVENRQHRRAMLASLERLRHRQDSEEVAAAAAVLQQLQQGLLAVVRWDSLVVLAVQLRVHRLAVAVVDLRLGVLELLEAMVERPVARLQITEQAVAAVAARQHRVLAVLGRQATVLLLGLGHEYHAKPRIYH